MLLFDKVLQKYYRSSHTSPVCLVMYPSLNLSAEFARLVELIRRRHLSPPVTPGIPSAIPTVHSLTLLPCFSSSTPFSWLCSTCLWIKCNIPKRRRERNWSLLVRSGLTWLTGKSKSKQKCVKLCFIKKSRLTVSGWYLMKEGRLLWADDLNVIAI